MAMGLQTAEAESSIRFSLGKNHQPDELMRAASEIKNAVTELRSI
jgi:cysteine sulfinate desulfinase/cysteine desulfurase-like protein